MNTTTSNTTRQTEIQMGVRLLRRLGMDMYMEGRPLSDCLTKAEQEGWWEGNRAEAECGTIGYAETVGF